MVAVGMPVTRHPPHRSQRALLTHWAPASGSDAQAFRPCRLSYPAQRLLQGKPALCPDPVLLCRVPLGQPPFLHPLRRMRRTTPFVRRLPRYYGAVRLPASVHHNLSPSGFTARTLAQSSKVRDRASRFPLRELPCMHGVSDPAGSVYTSP